MINRFDHRKDWEKKNPPSPLPSLFYFSSICNSRFVLKKFYCYYYSFIISIEKEDQSERMREREREKVSRDEITILPCLRPPPPPFNWHHYPRRESFVKFRPAFNTFREVEGKLRSFASFPSSPLPVNSWQTGAAYQSVIKLKLLAKWYTSTLLSMHGGEKEQRIRYPTTIAPLSLSLSLSFDFDSSRTESMINRNKGNSIHPSLK